MRSLRIEIAVAAGESVLARKRLHGLRIDRLLPRKKQAARTVGGDCRKAAKMSLIQGECVVDPGKICRVGLRV